jgi:lysophospholipase L1-like esterase
MFGFRLGRFGVSSRSGQASDADGAGGQALESADKAEHAGTGPEMADEPTGRRVLLDIRHRDSSVEHYFHFLLGFLTPLVLRRIEREPETRFVVRSCGPMDAHLHALGLANLDILPKQAWVDLRTAGACEREQVFGYDAPAFYDADAFTRMGEMLRARFGVAPAAVSDDVLLIRRGASPAFYQSDLAEVKTSAALRRTIPNLGDIATAIEGAGLGCRTEALETQSLEAQLGLFARARTVVAQHGAALANMLWMAPGGLIVEVNPKPDDDAFVDHFRALAVCCGHDYVCVKQANPDALVDPGEILAVFVARGRLDADAAGRGVEVARQAVDTRPDGTPWPPAARPAKRDDVGNWERSLARTQWAMKQQQVDLVWLGDSIAHRFERKGPPEWSDYCGVWDRYYAHRNALNLGASGDDTRHLIWRLMYGGMEKIQPKLAIITIGANNFIQLRFGAEETAVAIRRVVELTRQAMPSARILLLGVPQGFRGPRIAGQIARLNRLLAEQWDGADGVVFVNANDCLRSGGKLDASAFAETHEDPPGVAMHPTAQAMERIVQFIEPHVARLLQP